MPAGARFVRMDSDSDVHHKDPEDGCGEAALLAGSPSLLVRASAVCMTSLACKHFGQFCTELGCWNKRTQEQAILSY